jgi:N-acetylglutamate synthase-like GNAT family acetyltransferase
MTIVDLEKEHEDTYCKCLEDWSAEMKDAGDLKKIWLERKKPQGLRVKLAKNEKNEIVGMIHYIPIEYAPAKGKDLYYIYCVWVHGYKEGVGNYQKKGIGRLLLAAAEQDCREKGAKGIAAWGITLPFFMQSKWFKKSGYMRADKDGMMELVWKPFAEDAVPPSLLKMEKKPATEEGKVTVTCFRNGWCPAQNMSCERMKKAVGEHEDKIKYVEINTDDRENMDEWGIADAIFIDGKLVNTGPPPSLEKLRKLVGKRVKKLK